MGNNMHPNRQAQFSGPALSEANKVAILIHGRAQCTDDMFAIADRINLPEVSYAAIEAANNSWYPEKFMAPRESNQPSLDSALECLDALVEQIAAHGLPRSKIVLIGFSQGACLACEYIYHHPQRWGGLIAFTGGLIGPEGTSWRQSGGLDGTPVLLSNSDYDPWVPLQRTQDTLDVFHDMGAVVEGHVYLNREHIICEGEVDLARGALLRIP